MSQQREEIQREEAVVRFYASTTGDVHCGRQHAHAHVKWWVNWWRGEKNPSGRQFPVTYIWIKDTCLWQLVWLQDSVFACKHYADVNPDHRLETMSQAKCYSNVMMAITPTHSHMHKQWQHYPAIYFLETALTTIITTTCLNRNLIFTRGPTRISNDWHYSSLHNAHPHNVNVSTVFCPHNMSNTQTHAYAMNTGEHFKMDISCSPLACSYYMNIWIKHSMTWERNARESPCLFNTRSYRESRFAQPWHLFHSHMTKVVE